MEAKELNKALEQISRKKLTATVKKKTFNKLMLIKLNGEGKSLGQLLDTIMEYFDEKGNPISLPVRPREGFSSIRE